MLERKKGAHSKTQEGINDAILSYVKQGFTVARLKGGDPAIFGRLGEEMEWCRKHGIAYEVISGVSSAIAAPTWAGIPLTHRYLSRSVAFFNGNITLGRSCRVEACARCGDFGDINERISS